VSDARCLQVAWARAGHLLPWAILLAGGVALALLPLPWIAIAVPGAIVVGITLIQPQRALYLLCLAVPFGSLFQVSLGGIAIGVAEGLIALMMAAWIARLIAFREEATWPRLSFAVALFIGATLLSLLNATALPFTFKEVAKWVEFLAVMFFVANVVTLEQRRGVVASLLLAGVAQSILGGYQFLAQSGPESFALMGRFMRAYGTFEQPNPYAGYLGLVVPLAFALGTSLLGRQEPAGSSWSGWLALTSFVAISAAIGMSWSRGAWLASGAAFAVINVARSRRGAIVFTTLIVLVALVGLLSSLQLLPEAISQRLTAFLPFVGVGDVRSVQVTDENYAAVERLAHWQAALDMWRDHPWLGVGFGNYEAAYADYALPKWPVALGHAHNYYLNVASEAGLIGLIAYLTLWGVALWQTGRAVRQAKDRYAKALALGVLGMLVHVSVHNIVDNLWVHNMYVHVAIVLGLVQIPAHHRSTFA